MLTATQSSELSLNADAFVFQLDQLVAILQTVKSYCEIQCKLVKIAEIR